VKLSLCLINYASRHEDLWGSVGIAPPLLTPALYGANGQLHVPAALPLKERASVIYWVGGWLGFRAGMDAMEKKKISCPCRESIPDHPAHSLSLYRLSYPGFGSQKYALSQKNQSTHCFFKMHFNIMPPCILRPQSRILIYYFRAKISYAYHFP
jgi:hypothetical protein